MANIQIIQGDFEQKQKLDSAVKYSALAYSLNYSVYRQMATDKIIKELFV